MKLLLDWALAKELLTEFSPIKDMTQLSERSLEFYQRFLLEPFQKKLRVGLRDSFGQIVLLGLNPPTHNHGKASNLRDAEQENAQTAAEFEISDSLETNRTLVAIQQQGLATNYSSAIALALQVYCFVRKCIAAQNHCEIVTIGSGDVLLIAEEKELHRLLGLEQVSDLTRTTEPLGQNPETAHQKSHESPVAASIKRKSPIEGAAAKTEKEPVKAVPSATPTDTPNTDIWSIVGQVVSVLGKDRSACSPGELALKDCVQSLLLLIVAFFGKVAYKLIKRTAIGAHLPAPPETVDAELKNKKLFNEINPYLIDILEKPQSSERASKFRRKMSEIEPLIAA
jgi:hypothetical protein